MSSADTNNIGIRLQAAGENLNTWGDPYLNNDLIVLSNLASKWKPLTINGDYTVSETLYSTTNDTEVATLDLVAGAVAGPFNFTLPSRMKRILLRNSSGFTGTPKLAATTGFVLPTGRTVLIATDGVTDVVNMTPNYGGVASPTSGSLDIPAWVAVEAAIQALIGVAMNGLVLNSAGDPAASYLASKLTISAAGLLIATLATTNGGTLTEKSLFSFDDRRLRRRLMFIGG